MKAFILAAGFGTRLLPYSRSTPKPLFTLNGRPILDLTIQRLQQAGFDDIMINTHHGHEHIEHFLSGQFYRARVTLRQEPQILGTGGAVGNIADWWRQGPLLIINADIVSDIDLAAALDYHLRYDCPVTMVVHDCPRFNSVIITPDGLVAGFLPSANEPECARVLAYTGIQIINPQVLDYIPSAGPADIISVYRAMLQAGLKINSLEVRHHYWQDIGTPQSYTAAAIDYMAPLAFQAAFGIWPETLDIAPLAGDGSDRRWFRLRAAAGSLIMVDHGIRDARQARHEVDAFVAIGRHLHAKGAAVPRLYLYDGFSGLVFLQDLGDRHLQDEVRGLDRAQLTRLYHAVIDQWVQMALEGRVGFDPAWTWQTEAYNRSVILEKECRYFVEAFARDYLGLAVDFDGLDADFQILADEILDNSVSGFMHRDLQSRNILLHNGRPFFIDFQAGRTGPLQYDLAALLIDPYTGLPQDLQDDLRDYAARCILAATGASADKFRRGYRGCALSRNLQILGAFAFLSRVKGKRYFEAYIPAAVHSLQRSLAQPDAPRLPELTRTVASIVNKLDINKGEPHG